MKLESARKDDRKSFAFVMDLSKCNSKRLLSYSAGLKSNVRAINGETKACCAIIMHCKMLQSIRENERRVLLALITHPHMVGQFVTVDTRMLGSH